MSEPSSGRLMSLDVFRGATIAAMMLVNNPGTWADIYPPLRHAAWHGWTITDLIFPYFLWIVGMAMTLSFAKRIERGDDKKKLFVHVGRRAVIIFLLGIFLTGFPKLFPYFDFSVLSYIRIPGVLQRIAVCYLIASAIFLWSGVRGQIIWTVGLLVVYWLMMMLIPVPGFGAGNLTMEGNFSHYIDSILLNGHMWTATKTWDPEGVVSTLPAIATTLFGILTGHLLRSKMSPGDKTAWMFVMGNLLIVAGTIMDFWMPINKNIWSASYSVFIAGMATVMFAVCYWIIDVQGYKNWSKPLAIYGMNAITVFVLSGILGRLVSIITWTESIGRTTFVNSPEWLVSIITWIAGTSGKEITLKGWMYSRFFVPLGSPMNVSLYFALAWVLMLYGIAYFMYKRNWFLKV